ncbi:hypothetical protein BDQ17DRAFT_1419944 [Cyathus striatus]|nr:hypothetical protein BDQ17DRAFT_1419944 [Cyathus striatus]
MLSFLTLSLLYVSLIIGSHPTIAAIYPVVKEYSGPNFFDDWDFFDDYDSTTSGDEIYLGAQATSDAKLAFVDSQTNHAFLKVDNTTTVVFDNKRNSVKITTKDSFNMGSVWVADIFHVPFGCSVWPAMWSWAPIVNTSWPAGGEIDTLEGFNQAAFS